MKRTASGIAVEKKFNGETLRADGPTRDEMRRVVKTVTAVLPERGDYLPVLRALLGPMRASLPPHGASPSSEYKAARKAWLARCRQWVVEQGREPVSTQLSMDEQRDYVAATGDRWDPEKWRAGR